MPDCCLRRHSPPAEPQCQQSSPSAELTSEFPLRQPSLLLLLGWPQVPLVTSQTTGNIFRPRQRKLVVVFCSPIKTKHEIRIADRLSIASRAPSVPFGVQQRGLKKAAERPSAGSQKTAGRSSAGSVTAAAVRKDKERKVEIEPLFVFTVVLMRM